MIGVDGWGAPRTRPVSWYDPAIPAAAAAALPGRELLQAIIEGRLPPPPIASLVGGELVSVGDGQALFRITPDESTYNPIGMVHGGLLCTMLDSAAGCAVQTLLPAGVGFSSIEIKVSFLKALRAGDGPQRARTSAAAPEPAAESATSAPQAAGIFGSLPRFAHRVEPFPSAEACKHWRGRPRAIHAR
jgi:uncharacterized protein (TIGR00369 family)